MDANKISLKTIAVSTAAVFLIEAGFRFAVVGKTVFPLPALAIVRCLESVLLVVIVSWLEKGTGAIGLLRPKIMTGFMRGLIWSACFAIAAGILFIILIAIGVNALDFLHGSIPSSWQHIVGFLLVGGVIGPIAEEVFFRGVIYGFFRQWGAVIAIILSTLIFVITHPIGGSIPVTQLVGGIVFALAYEKEQNLMVPITIHCLGNLAIFSLTILI
ncbi:hypothetical protein D1BOALGB6SA_8373 [Olavius sp. associated proteobacterium Delta 1]|nr:hypothetical protein D1BOALGB6SA_8373 [Olavius sp. associated proteobacterium Delta 1]